MFLFTIIIMFLLTEMAKFATVKHYSGIVDLNSSKLLSFKPFFLIIHFVCSLDDLRCKTMPEVSMYGYLCVFPAD